MKKCLVLALLWSCSVHLVSAQGPVSDAGGLKISWEFSENNYQKKGELLSVLTLTNTGTRPLPAKGWTVYFNGAVPHNEGDTSVISVARINGDYLRFSPGKSFSGLAPNASVQVKLLSRPLRNITDYPKGFYIVFDADPFHGIALPLETKSAIDYTKQEKAIAQKQYAQNSSVQDLPEAQLSPVFPSPVSYRRTAALFKPAAGLKIMADKDFGKEAAYLAEEWMKVTGVKPSVAIAAAGAATAGAQTVYLQKKAVAFPEGYELSVTADQVVISASDAAGVFYGIQSLKVLLPPNSWDGKHAAVSIAGMEIKDHPRFPHRAFMMDLARNFQQKSEVIKLIDVLSLYKINVLHLHLNDDEGWRIEIPGLPELTEIGSKRGHTTDEQANLFPSYGSGPSTGNTSGTGFLTKADYLEILRYATARHMIVIPEFETPGHARAAIKSMNARYKKLMTAGKTAEATQYLLRDLDDQSVYRSVQGWSDNVINPALPSVYHFLEKITDETIAMYKEAGAPLQTIHFGGDEVPAGVWEKSPAVAALLKSDPSIDGVDDMWHYYFEKLNVMLKQRGLYLSGWEETGLKKALVDGKKKMIVDTRAAGNNFHTDVWNNLSGNEDLAYKLANAGYKVVLTNVTNMYLDLAYSNSDAEPGQYWGGYVDVDKPFSFIPFDYYRNQKEDERGQPLDPSHFNGKERLTEAGKANIVGLQAPLWSEIITSPERFEYLLLPKLFGLAERSWAADPDWATAGDPAAMEQLYQKSWSAFVNVIGKKELPRLNAYAGGFSYRIPTAGVSVEQGMVKANAQYPGFVIRYTTDGTEPAANSKVYSGDLPASANLSFRLFNSAGRGGRTVKYVK